MIRTQKNGSTLDVSGSSGSVAFNCSSGHLILSSSAGSIVGMSASADFVNTDKPYHIRSVNSDLILSSSAGSAVIISGTNLTFTNDAAAKSGHVVAKNSSLVLSSSTGTTYVSGSLVATTNVLAGYWINAAGYMSSPNFYNSTVNATLDSIYGFVAAPSLGISFVSASVYNHARDIRISRTTADGTMLSISSSQGDSGFTCPSGKLILSSSLGSVIAASGSLDLVNTDKAYHIRAVNSDLILSSSAGSYIVASGNIAVATISGACIPNVAASLSVPTLCPTRQDLTTGLGHSLNVAYPALAFIVQGGAWWTITYTGNLGSNNTNCTFTSRGKIINDVAPLILSSSAGSIVYISGNLKTNGFRTNQVEKLAQYTILADDYFVKADATSASFGCVLPTAVGVAGKQYCIKKVDVTANAVIVSGTAAETIDGAATSSLASQWSSITVIADGNNWLVVD
jgi:hypothetical protein